MKIRTLILLAILTVIIIFAALNWGAFTENTTLSLGVTSIQAPLGLIMLGLVAFVTVLFLVFLIYLQTTFLLEARRHTRELEASRKLADQAELSRFTELHGFIEAELQKIAGTNSESTSAILKNIDQVKQELHSAIEQSSNTLSAYMGELEDRFERFGQDRS